MSIVRHRLKYTANRVPLDQVIESLRSQQRLLVEAVALLQEIDSDSRFSISSIEVSSIESSSLIIDLLVELYSSYQKNIDKTVIGGVESMVGVDVPPELETLVTLIVFALVYFVSRAAYDAVRKKKKEPQVPPIHIQGDYNNVITIIADRLNVAPSDVNSAIERVVHPSKFRQLVKPVADFLRPAKSQPGSKIEGADADISADSIREFPSDAELGVLSQTEIVDFPNALIDIRQLNKDSGKTGWYARIASNPDMQDRRLPMDLYPTVNATDLARHDMVRADLVVEMLRNAKGEMIPKRLHLLAYREPTDDDTP